MRTEYLRSNIPQSCHCGESSKCNREWFDPFLLVLDMMSDAVGERCVSAAPKQLYQDGKLMRRQQLLTVYTFRVEDQTASGEERDKSHNRAGEVWDDLSRQSRELGLKWIKKALSPPVFLKVFSLVAKVLVTLDVVEFAARWNSG
jgi:hypothetical protein